MIRSIATCLTFILLSLVNTAMAAPGIDYFSRSDLNSDVQISPDGSYLSIHVDEGGKQGLAILDTATMKPLTMVRFKRHRYPGTTEWVSNHRIMYRLEEMDAWFRVGHYGEWLAQEVDGTREERIFSFRGADKQAGSHIKVRTNERAWGFFVDRLRQDDENVLLTKVPFDDTGTAELIKLDVYLGTFEQSKFSPVEDPVYITDLQSRPRFVTGNNQTGELRTYYWDLEGADAQLIASGSHETGYLSAVSFKNDLEAYVEDNREAQTVAVELMNMSSMESTAVFHHPGVDPSRYFMDEESRALYAIEYEVESPQYHFVDEANKSARVLKGLLKVFSGKHVQIVSQSDDSNLNVAFVFSDTDPGAYFLYNYETKEAQHLVDVRPWVTPGSGPARETFTIKASDGLPLNIHLTRPSKNEKADLVVLLQPQPVRNTWGYDPMVQMLAVMGYSVLQIDYRGVNGFGRTHEQLGIWDWGTSVAGDIIDAVRYVSSENLTSGKACIYGERFGAFLSLRSTQLEPQLFSCAAAVGGVFDPRELVDIISLPWHYDSKDYAEVLKSDKARMSALNLLDSPMSVPVMLAYGGATIDPSLRATGKLRAKLKNDKKSKVIKMKQNKSGFYGDEAKMNVYKEFLGFLEKNLK